MPTAACPGDDKESLLLQNKLTLAPAHPITQEIANPSEISLAT